MGTYIARRLLLMIPTLIGITFLVFMIVALAPGGIGAGLKVQGGAMESQKGVAMQRAYLEDRYGLNDPVVTQYARWLGRISPVKIGTRSQVDLSGNRVNPPRPIPEPPLWRWFTDALPVASAAAAPADVSGEALVAKYRGGERAYADARAAYVAATTTLKQSLGRYAREQGWAAAVNAKGDPRVTVLAAHTPDKSAPSWGVLAQAWDETLSAYAAATAARAQLHALFLAKPYPEAGIPLVPGVLSVASPDFGYAYSTQRPVIDLIAKALPVTLLLEAIAVPIVYLIAVPGGLFAATFRGRTIDAGSGALFIGLYSIPTVLAGVFCIGFLASKDYLGAFPVSGMHANGAGAMRFLPSWQGGDFQAGYLGDLVWHVALPVVCLVYAAFAVLSKQTRAAMLDNFSADYVRTAKAKGVAGKDVVLRHVFRNSLLPVITMFVSIFPAMLSGSVVIEKIFTIPGMGSLTYSAIALRDRELLLATTLMIAAVNLFGLLLADILYALADPRISYE
jgi:ABC-type dipeptide/oligopeptide/nickel transport system permease component